MTDHAFHVVDVFTDRRFGGNPLAVFPDARGIPESLFQTIAREFNLSETTFVLPPDDPANHCKVRIFTPAKELPMAGHPTVGTAYVLTREGVFDPTASGGALRFEEGVGLIPVTVEQGPDGPGLITMNQPLPEFGPVFENRKAIADMLGLSPEDLLEGAPIQSVSCGVPYCLVALRNLDAIVRAEIQPANWKSTLHDLFAFAVMVFTLETEHQGHDVHARMFAPELGIVEDPATGSAAGPLGSYLLRHGLIPPPSAGSASTSPALDAASGSTSDSPSGHGEVEMICEQGFEMGRPSLLNIGLSLSDNPSKPDAISAVRVGGLTVPVSRGVMHL